MKDDDKKKPAPEGTPKYLARYKGKDIEITKEQFDALKKAGAKLAVLN